MMASSNGLDVLDTGRTITTERALVVIAGYTGADASSVQHHIDELAAIGIPPPATVPAFYPMPTGLLTHDDVVDVEGGRTSGEVEPVILRIDGRFYLGVGSDHTDRDLERESIAGAKAACPKPMSRTVIEMPDDGLDWSAVTIRSVVDGQPYQEGSVASLRPPDEVFASCSSEVEDGEGDLVMFGGTVPLLTGTFLHGERWSIALEVPGHPPIEHTYVVRRAGTELVS